MSEKFKLTRIPIIAFCNLSHLVVKNGEITKDVLSTDEMFSRMMAKDDYENGERIIIAKDGDYFSIYVKDKGEMVFCCVDGNMKIVGTFEDFNKDNDNVKKVEQNQKKEMAIQKLSGRSSVSLVDDMFKDGDSLTVVVEDENTTIECVTHKNYINIVHNVWCPYEDNGKIKLMDIDCNKNIYRFTDDKRNSYLMIPKGTTYIVEDNDSDSDTFHSAELYCNGEKVCEEKDVETLLKKNEKKIFDSVAGKKIPNINPAKCNVFVIVNAEA